MSPSQPTTELRPFTFPEICSRNILSVHIIDTYFRPTMSPSPSPTESPSPSPTQSPSTPTSAPTIPTVDPTSDPTEIFCEFIIVEITDFDAFNSDDLNDDVILQDQIGNITYFAIAQNAEDDGIESGSFYVRYGDSSAESQYVDDEVQRSLFINQSLCAYGSDDLDTLTVIILYEDDEIEVILADKLTALYLDGQASDSMVVSIYVFNQFGCFVTWSHAP